MKKLNLNENIKDLFGNDIVQNAPGKDENGDPKTNAFNLTLGYALKVSILANTGERSCEDVLKRIEMIDKLNNKDEISLSEKEIGHLKDLVVQAYDTYVAGRVLQILNK